MNTLQIGFARECYSPDKPMPQNSKRTGYSVLTDIYVTCVAMKNGEKTVLIFSNDLRGLAEQWVKKYRENVMEETGLPDECIQITVTHNHSGPDISYYHRREDVADWVDRICFPAVRRAASAALADLAPVTRVTSGKTDVENVTFARRYLRTDGTFSGIQGSNGSDAPLSHHENEADTQLRVLRFYREGKKDVVFANFQVHAATALGASHDVICSDFLHEFRRVVEESGELSVLYLQGGCGNLNTYSKLYPDACNKDYDRAGRLLGEGVLRALEHEEERHFDGLCVQKEYYTGIVDHTRDHLLEKAQEVQKIIRENGLDDKTGREIYTEAGFSGRLDCSAIVTKSRMEKTAQIPLCTICFGDVGMTFAPFEMFDTNCIQIREASPFEFTLTVCYANARHHYLPSAYSFTNGGYECQQCYYIPGTGETVALEFLKQLKKAKKHLQ
ncbi:MAG: hypothetical protein E7580_06685 [Ruminococcaceae bacterium]|nr:hypothetical protein [Oscillospiraceae bacterium]